MIFRRDRGKFFVIKDFRTLPSKDFRSIPLDTIVRVGVFSYTRDVIDGMKNLIASPSSFVVHPWIERRLTLR